MLSFYHRDENVSYVFANLDGSTSKLSETSPRFVEVTKENLQTLFDAAIDDRLLMHWEKESEIYDEILTAQLKIVRVSTKINDTVRKNMEEVLLKKQSDIRDDKPKGILHFKKQLQTLTDDTVDWSIFSRLNRLYYTRIKGAFSQNLETYMTITFWKKQGNYANILKRFFEEYIQMYPWRMEHFTNIQKFYIRTKDVIIGLTRDLQYIQDVSCPKLYALIDRDSLNYQNIQITLTGNTIAASLEFNSPDGKHVTTLSENFDLDLPINLNSEEIPENTKALYGNYAWKSEMIILTPLIIQFFTPIIQDLFAFPVSQDKITPRAEVQNNRDSFMNALRRLIDGHICPSREKVAELVGYYFDSPLSESFQTLFIDVIYTIMHSPDGSPKENFRDDVVRIVEILNQYEQSL